MKTTSKSKLFMVVLRQPRKSDKNEMRSDPFWEFGSFGMTGCHSHNLMNIRNIDHVRGVRLAFAQGGPDDIRLVYITPPVVAKARGGFFEATWTPSSMPLRFENAPVIINRNGDSDFDRLCDEILSHKTQSNLQKFTSAYRARTSEVENEIADEIIRVFNKFFKHQSNIAKSYEEALPYLPRVVDKKRKSTLLSLRKDSMGTGSAKSDEKPIRTDSKKIRKSCR